MDQNCAEITPANDYVSSLACWRKEWQNDGDGSPMLAKISLRTMKESISVGWAEDNNLTRHNERTG
jgi:hypothetical protein